MDLKIGYESVAQDMNQ